MSAEEIDLTTDTPPKKMKQARLPFASLDKVATSPQIGECLFKSFSLSINVLIFRKRIGT